MRLSVKLNPAWRRDSTGADRRLWILRTVALRVEAHTNPLWKFEVYWKRLLLLLVGGGVAAYLAATLSLWFFLQRNPANQVGWADVLALPFDRAAFQHKRGDTAVRTGLRQFKEREYAEAYFNLRAGVGRSPGNVEGRLLLARQIGSADLTRAITLLEEGVAPTHGDVRVLRALFSSYNLAQARERALGQSGELLAQTGDRALPAASRAFVVGARVALLLELGRAAEALPLLAGPGAPPSDPGVARQWRLLEVEALLRSGRAAEARTALEQFAGAGPAAADTLYLQAEIATALDDPAALQSALVKLRALSPGSPGPLLYAFRAWHRLKRPTRRDAVEQDYCAAFGANDAALQAFAALLVNLDLPEVIARVQAVAAAARLSPFAFQVHLTEVALRRGEFERATRLLRGWENQVVTLGGGQKFYPEFLKLLTRAAFTGSEQPVTALVSHLTGNHGQVPLPVYLLAVAVLDRAASLPAEQLVLRAALARFPFSDPLLAAQKNLEARLAAAATKPAAAVAEAPVAVPPTAVAALRQIDALLQADSLAAARDLLRAIRAARPAWLAAQDAEFSLRELRLALAAQDLLSTRTQLRQFLDRFHTEPDALALVRLAAGLVADQRFDAARVVHDEVRVRFGGNIRVVTALRELQLPDDLAATAADATGTLRTLDQWLDTRQLAQAERLLAYLRDKPPQWLAAVKHEVRVREVRLNLALDQAPQALVLFRPVVLQPGASRGAAFRLVRETFARGEQAPALALAAEIVRLLPDDQAAAKLLKEVRTPVPAADAP